MTSPPHEITILLSELGAGREGAMDRLDAAWDPWFDLAR
jgi:hypothetical protein